MKKNSHFKVAPRPPGIPKEIKRTFVCTTNGHYKFYELEVEFYQGSNTVDVHCRWGRIGNAPQEKTERFPDLRSAQTFMNKKAGEKLGKEYVETTDNPNYTSDFMSKTFEETPESQEKFDLFLNSLKL